MALQLGRTPGYPGRVLALCPLCNPATQSVIHETELTLALHAPCPVGSGHVVVVTRRHVATYFEATAEEKAELWRSVEAVKARLDSDYAPEGYTVGFDTAPTADPATEHLHLHVIPRSAAVCRVDAAPGEAVSEERDALATSGRAIKASFNPLSVLPQAAPSSGPQLSTGLNNPLAPHLFRDLESALRVDIAVAFVFSAALHSGVLSRLRDVLARDGSRVRLLTGDYQGVTEPTALRSLLTLKEQADESGDLRGSVELRVFQTERAGCSFHPKAYLLYADAQGHTLASYVGSSNLSRTALFDGVEWNLRLAAQDTSELTRQGFEELFTHDATCELSHAWVDAYDERRPAAAAGKALPDVPLAEDEPVPVPEPSSVQADALDALEATREMGNRAGLVVLATGLGKTWLSAFDSTPERGFERVLFVAHREEILAQAMSTYARIRPNASVGLYTGRSKAFEAALLFASVQTLSQEQHLARFAADHFDYIVVDEFHHAAAETYRRVLDHFAPKFLLGLTATPERTDGGDLLALCDENVVFECGLAAGVRKELLSPFHYFGVPDIVEYEQIPWRSRRFDEQALTEAVATTARAQNALEQLREHGGTRVLGFCVSQRHADFMRDYFREHTELRCASVHSGPSSDSRSLSLEQLELGELDVLFCVDMFNEGLDVPSIDTVLMLRPTESKVIWLQQLGRGLRKHVDKSHLRVIDYIGNHRSFLEKPAALLAALGVVVSSKQEMARLLAERAYELPPGCEVTYSLEAQAIVEKLCPPSRAAQTIREWYAEFREHAERRPTAREALHSGYDPRAVNNDYGSWLEFVREMGDLSETEQAALKLDREFFVALETRVVWRSHPWVLLDALRAAGQLPGALAVTELAVAYGRRASRSAPLKLDAGVDLNDESAVQQALLTGPIATWCDATNAAGQPFFALDGDVFRTSDGIRGRSSEFGVLAAELIEWRIAEYLSRRPQQPVLAVARNAAGQPILKLDRKRYELPEDWVLVAADSAPYRVRYLKHTVDVARPPDGDGNELGKLLKGWFGDEAGASGAKHRVIQKTDAHGRLTWEPLVPHAIVDDGDVALDAKFDLEDFEGEPTIVLHSRGADRNSDYARGLELLLQRLGQAGVEIVRIAVESGGTRALPLAQRILHIEGVDYPIELNKVDDVVELRKDIGKAGAAVGRKPGAKGAGNPNKRLRIWLSRTVEADVLARRER